MNNYNHDNLEIVIKEDNGDVRLLWTGTSTSRDPASLLGTYLDAVLNEASNYKNIVFDFGGLKFMNSSTIAVILHFMDRLKDHPTHFEMIFSKEKDWQEILFRTLRIVTSRMNNIEVSKN